jgi:hypothetical protein
LLCSLIIEQKGILLFQLYHPTKGTLVKSEEAIASSNLN